MVHQPREKFDNCVVEWIDSRMPIFTMLQKEYGVFPTPRNFNYFWNFGAIAMFMLVTMIVTGVVLAMHYTADTKLAFDSVERIMRDVNGGWLLRYIHMNGASFFFIAVYIHIFRGMYYGSYKRPRELLWLLGVVIFLLMMATAFIGYVLPWGQMSLWGATVITNLFSAIPFVGEHIVTLLWGGFSVDNPTLTRFFALHYLLPFIIFAVVFLHVWALHVTGSNNPLGIDVKGPQDTIPFNPYYTMKDFFGLSVFIIIYCLFVFYMPDALGHPDNYIPANPLVTPPHIVPEWYFLPFYAILRAITFNMNLYMIVGFAVLAFLMVEFVWRKNPRILGYKLGTLLFLVGGALAAFGFMADLNQDWGIPLSAAESAPIPAKLGGVLAMFGSIAMLFILPWLDTHPIRSARFRPLFKLSFLLLFVLFVALGYIGSQAADATLFGIPLSLFGLAFTGYYFGFFLVILPLLNRFEKGRTLPSSIHEAVLAKSHSSHAGALA